MKTSSDVTPWLPAVCARCGKPIVRSRESFFASFAGSGSVYRPVSVAWHLFDETCVQRREAT